MNVINTQNRMIEKFQKEGIVLRLKHKICVSKVL